jgi:hypothetical protein
MVDAFSILTIAEDKGLHIADSSYVDIAMDLLDEKIGFDSNSFFYILTVLKTKNIRLPIVLKEKMILSCKMFIFTYSSFINPSQMPVKSCALL